MHISSGISIGKNNLSNFKNIFYVLKEIYVLIVLSQIKMNITAFGFLTGFIGKEIDEGLNHFE
jgi:hypothetical protein